MQLDAITASLITLLPCDIRNVYGGFDLLRCSLIAQEKGVDDATGMDTRRPFDSRSRLYGPTDFLDRCRIGSFYKT